MAKQKGKMASKIKSYTNGVKRRANTSINPVQNMDVIADRVVQDVSLIQTEYDREMKQALSDMISAFREVGVELKGRNLGDAAKAALKGMQAHGRYQYTKAKVDVYTTTVKRASSTLAFVEKMEKLLRLKKFNAVVDEADSFADKNPDV
jgi:hypothetical protein